MTILRYLPRGSFVFDVGANIGEKTDIFLEADYKVIGYEPQLELHKLLIQKYHGSHSAYMKKLALGSKKTDKEIFYICNSSHLSTFSKKWINEGRFSGKYEWKPYNVLVNISTLEEEIRVVGLPDFVKIDVEGYEIEVIKGLGKGPYPKYISFEYTKEFFSDAEKCVDLLAEKGYNEFNFTVGEYDCFIFPLWKKNKEVVKSFIRGLDDPLLFGDIYAKR